MSKIYERIQEADDYCMKTTGHTAWSVLTVLARRGKRVETMKKTIDSWNERVIEHNRSHKINKIGRDNFVKKFASHLLITGQDMWEMRLQDQDFPENAIMSE